MESSFYGYCIYWAWGLGKLNIKYICDVLIITFLSLKKHN